jgi:hypothetical protein
MPGHTSDRLLTLATFPSITEAALARGILAEADIPAQISDGTAGWAFGQLVGSVRLIVREGDAERAEQVLDEALAAPLEVIEDQSEPHPGEASDFAENLVDRSADNDQPAWTCAACGARVQEDERRCWSCGTSRTGEPNPYYIRPESAVAPLSATSNVAQPDPPEHIRDWIVRAWRAAWLSPILLPPLANFYSVWLLLHAARENIDLTPKYNLRFYVALLINLIVTAAAIMFWASIIRA